MKTILQAIDDPRVFGGLVKHETYGAWRAFLAALFGLPMTDAEAALYRECTGRLTPPDQPFREAWLPCGRRGGKSFTVALVAVYLACFRDYSRHLAPGERGTIMIMAADRKQARVIFRYIRGLLEDSPALRHELEEVGQTAEMINLRNRVTIEVATASHKSTRGYTVLAALCDEIAFWGAEDSASPDVEILNALRPGMGMISGAMLLAASSPYARRGALWDAFRTHHGQDDAPVLVWRAPTRTMNPLFPKDIVDQAMKEDAAKASAEYGAEFRTDVASFVTREAVDACISAGILERAPAGHAYVAFVDPSGGSADSMTLAIAHREGDRAVLDAIREVKPPFSPEAVVHEFAALLRRYGVDRVQGDRYGGEWPREVFRKAGITYDPSAMAKSEIYGALLPLLNSRRAVLLDDPRLVSQLCALERRTGPSGRDSIDHPKNQHDDRVNAAAGALVALVDMFPMRGQGLFALARQQAERAGWRPDGPLTAEPSRPSYAEGSEEHRRQQEADAALA